MPDKFRIEPVSKVAEAGKHIQLEKSITRTVDEATKVKEEIKEYLD